MVLKGEEHMIEFERVIGKLVEKGAVMPGKLVGVIGRCDKDIFAYVHSLTKKFESLRHIQLQNFERALQDTDSRAKKNVPRRGRRKAQENHEELMHRFARLRAWLCQLGWPSLDQHRC